ncbi:MAG TPA: hypothetical protein VK249_28450 [Anaerolineales bacterium]|nr:hypothetical protein [Anaerolineales bacterium]
MPTNILESAQTFIWNNARLLERQLFSFLFREGTRQSVVSALSAYQNEDGGFGNALEPDKRSPSSQPIDQEFALRILNEVGFEAAIAEKVCDFLMTITTKEGGVPFVLPSVRDAPRADWWNTEDDPPASINPTASIAGLLHRHKFRHPWLEKATEYCWRKVEELQNGSEHDLLCAAIFLENVPDRDRAQRVFRSIGEQIKTRTAFDPYAPGYTFKPLTWAPAPGSICRDLFEDDQINLHLKALADQQQADGGWLISWTAVSPGCELEYRGVVTVRTLRMLKEYGYLQT